LYQAIGAVLDSLLLIALGAFALWGYPGWIAGKIERGEVGASTVGSAKVIRWSGIAMLASGGLGLLWKVAQW